MNELQPMSEDLFGQLLCLIIVVGLVIAGIVHRD